MGHFLAAVTVTVGYSDTFADPRGCHSNRRPLYRDTSGGRGREGTAYSILLCESDIHYLLT